jgi:transcriptional regulator with XRE-family HTH domain
MSEPIRPITKEWISTVKKCLKEQHMTQVELAERVGTSKQNMTWLLKGKSAGSPLVGPISAELGIELPPIELPKTTPTLAELGNVAKELSEEDQQILITMAKALRKKQPK